MIEFDFTLTMIKKVLINHVNHHFEVHQKMEHIQAEDRFVLGGYDKVDKRLNLDR